MTEYAFGRRVEHDPRSRQFPVTTTLPLRTVGHRHWGPVLDQGNLGSCVGDAVAQALNTVPLRRGRRLLNEDDAKDLYRAATRLDGFPGEWEPDDTGTSGLAGCKAAKQAGYITEYRHAFTLGQALGSAVVAPVIIGVNWYTGMLNPDSNGYLHPTGVVEGGHEVAVTGINVTLQRVTILNSWGRWGLNGRAHLSWDDLGQLLAEDGDCTIPLFY